MFGIPLFILHVHKTFYLKVSILTTQVPIYVNIKTIYYGLTEDIPNMVKDEGSLHSFTDKGVSNRSSTIIIGEVKNSWTIHFILKVTLKLNVKKILFTPTNIKVQIIWKKRKNLKHKDKKMGKHPEKEWLIDPGERCNPSNRETRYSKCIKSYYYNFPHCIRFMTIKSFVHLT